MAHLGDKRGNNQKTKTNAEIGYEFLVMFIHGFQYRKSQTARWVLSRPGVGGYMAATQTLHLPGSEPRQEASDGKNGPEQVSLRSLATNDKVSAAVLRIAKKRGKKEVPVAAFQSSV
jgi:hypothetical protein